MTITEVCLYWDRGQCPRLSYRFTHDQRMTSHSIRDGMYKLVIHIVKQTVWPLTTTTGNILIDVKIIQIKKKNMLAELHIHTLLYSDLLGLRLSVLLS